MPRGLAWRNDTTATFAASLRRKTQSLKHQVQLHRVADKVDMAGEQVDREEGVVHRQTDEARAERGR